MNCCQKARISAKRLNWPPRLAVGEVKEAELLVAMTAALLFFVRGSSRVTAPFGAPKTSFGLIN